MKGTAPITYFEASRRYEFSVGARERFEELTNRDLMARAYDRLQARGEFDPSRHGDPGKYPALTVDEHLEVLAVGELLARHYRWRGYVDYALRAGAKWHQIAEALGCDQDQARRDYRAYVDGQHRLWLDLDGRVGMSDSEYAAAIAKCSQSNEEEG